MSYPARPKGGLLGLDLAKRCGWAYARPGGEHTSGSFDLPPIQTWGAQCSTLYKTLWNILEAYQPRSCTIEAPLSLKTDAEENYRTAFGLASHAASCCYDAGVIYRTATPKTIRATCLRDGNIPGKIVKTVVIQFCRDRGWHVGTNDEADASIALLYEAWAMKLDGPYTATPWDRRRFWRPEDLL